MRKDKVFANKKKKVEPFKFNEQVTRVFDDMLTRSVPFYHESICRQAQLTSRYYQDKTLIYDLGCSNGNLGLQILHEMENQPFLMVGVDSSQPMIKTYAQRLKKEKNQHHVRLVCGLLENLIVQNASVVLINLTLQFLAPAKRDQLIKRICAGMTKGGILLLTEKIDHPSARLKDLQIEFYNRFKKENGYSDLEISQKRDALEKVLIPDTLATHRERLTASGFSAVDVWLRWFNFASIIAIK